MTDAAVRTAKVVHRGEAQQLQVMGAGVRFLCESETTGGAFSVMENDLPFGAGPPPHRHDWAEAYYLISGSVDFVIEGEGIRADAGSFIYAPPGALHGFSGASQEPARMLVFDAPAHAASFFREIDRQVKEPADYVQVPRIGAEHGIHFAL